MISTDSIEDLVARSRGEQFPVDQQHAAFAELVRRFEEMAFSCALRSLADAEEARDATQEAFLTAWLKLRTLRDPKTFGGWLKRLIVTQCNRRRRMLRASEPISGRMSTCEDFSLREKQRLLARALTKLSDSEHRTIVLFYFLGRKIDEIAGLLSIPRATVGKRLYTARLKIRRILPPSLRSEFVTLRPSTNFRQKIRAGLFDNYLGVYRFEKRPALSVSVVREGDLLVSYGGGQRNVLASVNDTAIITTAYDGEGRFQRDRQGRVTEFVYYEFGRRLGTARKIV